MTAYKAAQIFCLFFYAVAFGVVSAHGSGASFEEQSGDFLIDVGYDPAIVLSGEQVRFDFNIINTKLVGTSTQFTDVRVLLEKDSRVSFASGLHKPRFGKIGMTYVFPESGQYDLSVRFQNNGDILADASFVLNVDRGASSLGGPQGIILGIVGLLLGGAIVFIFKRRKNST